MFKRVVAYATIIALTLSPVPVPRNSVLPGGLTFVGAAEAGLPFKKLGALAVATFIVKAAAKGMTNAAKKRIAGYIAKFAHDGRFADQLMKALESHRGSVKNVDEIITFVRSKLPMRGPQPPSAIGEGLSLAGQYWTRVKNVGGIRVFQKPELFEFTPQNVGRMRNGFAPMGKDGKPVQLHHMLQKDGEALAEVGAKFHQQNTKALHINPNTVPSGIDRAAFETWKENYWRLRALEFWS